MQTTHNIFVRERERARTVIDTIPAVGAVNVVVEERAIEISLKSPVDVPEEGEVKWLFRHHNQGDV